jgi:hypothetical protein
VEVLMTRHTEPEDAETEKPRRDAFKVFLVCVGVLTFVAIVLNVLRDPEPKKAPRVFRPPSAEVISAVSELRSAGVFRKIESSGEGSDVTVGGEFFSLEHDQRVRAVSWVGGLSGPDRSDYVRIFDAYTGKKIGYYLHGSLSLKGDR